MFKTSGRASFLIILFQFLQYYVFVVLSGDAFAFFTGTFIATPSLEKKIAYKTFLYFRNDFFTRCRFWPTWFRCIFDGLYTRLKFLFPPPNCVIRHTRRSKSSRNFSHQLLQRTTKFWASFDVISYFIFFVDASTNHFYCSGQWLRVFKWQILCLTLSLTCTFIHHCVDIE